MDFWDEGLFLLVLFLANTIQAVTGFAGTLLAMAPSMLLLGPDQAKVILNIMAFLSSLFIVSSSLSYVAWRQLLRIVLYMAAGMIAGIYLSAPAVVLLAALLRFLCLGRCFEGAMYE